jgi:hypothetical protein
MKSNVTYEGTILPFSLSGENIKLSEHIKQLEASLADMKIVS